MSKRIATLGLMLVLLGGGGALAQSAGSVDARPAALGVDYSRGAQVASELTQLTGVMLSPLLGMVAVGVYDWFRATPAQRTRLPWHDRPWAWGTMLTIMVGLFLGHRIPVLKHGFKQLKVIEDKVFGLVAIPWVAAGLASALAQPVGGALVRFSHALLPVAYASPGAAGGSVSHGFEWAVGYLAAVLIGAAVWLVGHAFNVLCTLSPFSLVDYAIKGVKFAALGLLLGATELSPTFGAGVAVLYILLALWVSGWTFRLMVFGWVFSSDVLFDRGRGVRLDAPVVGFASAGLTGVKSRTFGHLAELEGKRVFRYRNWLVGPLRTVPLPEGSHVLIRGLISPVLSQPAPNRVGLLRLPPRYRPHVAAIAQRWGIPVEDPPALRGWNAALRWVRAQMGRVETTA